MKTRCHIYQFSIFCIALLCSCVLTDILIYEPPDIVQIKTPVPEIQYNHDTHFALYWTPNKEPDLAGYHWNWLSMADSTVVDTLTEQAAIPDTVNWKTFNHSKMEGEHWFFLSAFDWSGNESENNPVYYMHVSDGIVTLRSEND